MKTTQQMLAQLQSQDIITLNALNVKLSLIAKELIDAAASLDGCNASMPDEQLASAHRLVIEAMYNIGQRTGSLITDAAIDAASTQSLPKM